MKTEQEIAAMIINTEQAVIGLSIKNSTKVRKKCHDLRIQIGVLRWVLAETPKPPSKDTPPGETAELEKELDEEQAEAQYEANKAERDKCGTK